MQLLSEPVQSCIGQILDKIMICQYDLSQVLLNENADLTGTEI